MSETVITSKPLCHRAAGPVYITLRNGRAQGVAAWLRAPPSQVATLQARRSDNLAAQGGNLVARAPGWDWGIWLWITSPRMSN